MTDGKDIVEAALTRIGSAPGSDQSTLLSDAAERFGKCLGFASVNRMRATADQQDEEMLKAVVFGIVPVSPNAARLASLEAEVARLLAENAILQRGVEIIAAADKPEPVRQEFPARALAFGAQRIGLLTIFS